MSGRKHTSGEETKSGTSKRSGDTVLDPAGDVEVVYQEVPPAPPKDKKIHERRPLPRIPEAPEDGDESNQ